MSSQPLVLNEAWLWVLGTVDPKSERAPRFWGHMGSACLSGHRGPCKLKSNPHCLLESSLCCLVPGFLLPGWILANAQPRSSLLLWPHPLSMAGTFSRTSSAKSEPIPDTPLTSRLICLDICPGANTTPRAPCWQDLAASQACRLLEVIPSPSSSREDRKAPAEPVWGAGGNTRFGLKPPSTDAANGPKMKPQSLAVLPPLYLAR